MKTVFLIISTLLLVGASKMTAQNTSQTVIIKMLESTSKPQIITITPEGVAERMSLEKNSLRGNNDKAFENNSLLLQKEINKWKKVGFKIDGVTHSVFSDNQFTTIIMSKDEKE